MKYIGIVTLMFCVLASNAQETTTYIYVKSTVPVSGNGTSWASPFKTLQEALTNAAGTTGIKQVWVAEGEYKPTYDLNRAATFNLPPRTYLLGGFAGNETSEHDRDWRKRRTVLSGDIGVQFDYSDNSYHVVTIKDSDGLGLDGFIVKYGNANGASGAPGYYDSGGGILVMGQSASCMAIIDQCEIVENKAAAYGGGIAFISDGGVITGKLNKNFFHGNSAANGGAVANVKIASSQYNNVAYFTNSVFSTNHASSNGGGMYSNGSYSEVTNCTFTKNNSISDGGGFYNTNTASAQPSIRNCILWKNFKGATESGSVPSQIFNSSSTPQVINNVIQGGYGVTADKNINADPKFIREPSFTGVYPRTSGILTLFADWKYENMLEFNGPIMGGSWPYYTYKDHAFNKVYLFGAALQVLDYNNMVNGKPTSTVYTEIWFTKMARVEKSIHTESNRIYIASHSGPGIYYIDRTTGVLGSIDPLDGVITHTGVELHDIIVDDVNDKLYASVFYHTNPNIYQATFYGILELDLDTMAKTWINNTTSPVSMPPITWIDENLGGWGVFRMLLDEPENTLYFSTGDNGVWWWNRGTNATGLINTSGGLTLQPGNSALPTNITTGMYMDHSENKFYIGTNDAGLYVYDRTNHTSKVYNKDNSLLIDNLINHIDKNDEKHLIYVGCELGGFWMLNTQTGEERFYSKDQGNEIFPQLMGTNIASTYYDEVDKKLYVSIDNPGGVWVWDYNNLVPDYGDLRLSDGSPAIDFSDRSHIGYFDKDVFNLPRFVDYPSVWGTNALDAGAHEKTFACQPFAGMLTYEKVNYTATFNPSLSSTEQGCTMTYSWNFGDGQTATVATPVHTYSAPGTYSVSLQMTVNCGSCPPAVVNVGASVVIENSLCGSIFCDPSGRVSIGTPTPAGGYKLSVGGKMIAEGAKVVVTSKWPDYVFDPQYTLMPLSDLKKYVYTNKHLPGVPNAASVNKTGIDIGDMSTTLLKKTEELTLYLLELDERLRKIEQKK